MNLTKLLACIVGVAFITSMGLSDANAEIVFNTGEDVTLEYFFDEPGSATASASSAVSAGVEFTDFPDEFGINFDFSRNFLSLDFSINSELNPSFSHIFKILDTTNSIADFEDVFISDGTSQVFKDAFTDPGLFTVVGVDEITLDLSGLDYEPGLTLQFEFNGGLSAVPEPGTFAFMGLAAAGLWTRGRLKKRQAA